MMDHNSSKDSGPLRTSKSSKSSKKAVPLLARRREMPARHKNRSFGDVEELETDRNMSIFSSASDSSGGLSPMSSSSPRLAHDFQKARMTSPLTSPSQKSPPTFNPLVSRGSRGAGRGTAGKHSAPTSRRGLQSKASFSSTRNFHAARGDHETQFAPEFDTGLLDQMIDMGPLGDG